MSTNIQNLLDQARQHHEERIKRETELVNANARLDRENNEEILRLAFAVLPEELRPYTRVEYLHSGFHFRLVICLPECAPIVKSVLVTGYEKAQEEIYERPRSKVTAISIHEDWVVSSWMIDHDDDEIIVGWRDRETCKTLVEAVAVAMQRGDNFDKVEQEAKEAEKRNQYRQAEAEKRKKLPYCPLKHANHALSDDPFCDTVKCAWFITWRGSNQCALKVIATSHAATSPEA